MSSKRKKRRTFIKKRWLIFSALLITITVGAVLWLAEQRGAWLTVLPAVIFTVLGAIIALGQWFFPASSNAPVQTLLHPHQTQNQNVSTSPSHTSTSVSSPTTHPVATGTLAAIPKVTFRSLIGFPPPTDPRTVQQRETTVKEVYARLTQDDTTALVLTGIGGVGKSTLAALIYRFAEERRKAGEGLFTAPALWLKIDSSSVTMSDLIGTIFDALGIPVPDVSSLAPHNQALTLLYGFEAAVGNRLIVLDQFENLLDWQTGRALPDRPGVGEWLDAINSQSCASRFLLTSRPWPLGATGYPPTYMQEYHVRGLEQLEGTALLHKLGVNATESELRQAVARCSGHAYALALLAALLRNRHLSLATFFKDPAYAQLWTGNVARNLLDRIYSEQLDPFQRQLLLAFSIYREPVSLEAALAVAASGEDMPHIKVQQELDALLNQHLLQPAGEGLYQLHAIVIGYANDHFDISSDQANMRALRAAHAKAAQYYRHYATVHCPRRELRRQRSDVQPLIEAIWQFCQAEQWQEAYELLEQEKLFTDLRTWGYSAVLLELYQQLLLPEKWQASPGQAIRIYNDLGEIYRTLGRVEDARRSFEMALDLSKTAHDRNGEGQALNYIGRICAVNNGKKALEYYEQALAANREVGNTYGEGEVLTNIGWAYSDFGWMDKALEKYEEVLQIHRTMKNPNGEASILNAMGRVYVRLNQKEKALSYYEQALHICNEIGDRNTEAWTFNNLGRVYRDMGDAKQSFECLYRALAIRREIGNRGGEGSTLNNLGTAYASRGQNEKALEYFEKALVIRREVGSRSGEAKTLDCIGRCYLDMKQPERAYPLLKQGLSIHYELNQERDRARGLVWFGRCCVNLGHYNIALASFLTAREGFTLLQATDPDSKRRLEKLQQYIDQLHTKLGDQSFVELIVQVEPQAHQLIEQELAI